MHENTRKALDALEEAIDDLQEEVEELKVYKETLNKARELATEISRRLSLGLDPAATETDFRELLRLLEES